MANITVTRGHNAPNGFVSGDTITDATLNAAQTPVVALTPETIVNNDISPSAAIALPKLGTGALPATITVATGNLVNASVTGAKLSGEQVGSAPIYGIRAWVNINGATPDNLNFNFTTVSAGTLVIVTTATAHNFRVGHVLFLEFISGGAQRPTNRAYTVTAVGPENTRFNAVGDAKASDTTGAGVVRKRSIRASGNVACVSPLNNDQNIGENGAEFAVNFAVALPDANYALSGLGARGGINQDVIVTARSTDVRTADACVIRAATGAGAQLQSCPLITAMFIR